MSEPTEQQNSYFYQELLNELTEYKPFDQNIEWDIEQLKNPPVDIDTDLLGFLLLSDTPYTYEGVKDAFDSDTKLLLTAMSIISNRFNSRDTDQEKDSIVFTPNEEILMFTGYSSLRQLYKQTSGISLLELIKSTRDNIIHSNLGLVRFFVFKKFLFLREDIDIENNDLIQDVYFILMNACDNFSIEYGNRFSTFTEACIKNFLLGFRTRKRRIKTDSLSSPDYDQIPDLENLEDIVDRRIIIDELKSSISNLKEKHQNILVLKYGLNNNRIHTLNEISDLYGTTAENIRQSKNKAEKKLKKYFIQKEYILDEK